MKKIILLAVAVFFLFSPPRLSGAQQAAYLQTSPEYSRYELRKEISTLNIGFEASSEELGTALNQMVGGEIYRGSTKISGLSLEILRSGPILASAADNYVYLTIPVSISLRYKRFGTLPVSSKLRFRVSARITPDWLLHAEIHYLGLSELVTEELGIGPLSFKPRSVVEGVTQPMQRVISDLVSRKFNEKYQLKALVAKAWEAARKPVLLDRSYRAWLKITPLEVILYPLSAADNRVKVSIGLISLAEVVVGPEPHALPPAPVPDLRLANGAEKNFRVALNTDLHYRDILEIARPLILNREMGSEGRKVIVREMELSGAGEKLIVKLQTEGSLDGVVYLSCRPAFNPETKVFSVEDVDFDLSTGSFLIKSAAWFLHSAITDRIAEIITKNLTEKLQQARDLAGKGLEQVRLAEHVVLRGSVRDIRLQEVAVQKEKLSIRVLAEGETTVNFQ